MQLTDILNKIKFLYYKFKIINSQRNDCVNDSFYSYMEKNIFNSMYENFGYNESDKATKFSIAWAARYYMNYAEIISSNTLKPYYVLTVKIKDNGEREKNSYKILPDCDMVVNCIKNGYNKNVESKEYYAATAYLMGEISRWIKGQIVIGYTFDEELANKFLTFNYSEFTTEDELDNAWQVVITTSNKLNILDKILGQKIKLVPLKVRQSIISTERPFKKIGWKMIKHQIANNEPINENAYFGVLQFSEIQNVLEQGNNLKGLNLNKQTQIAVIQRAIALGVKPDGTKYIDDLRTEDGWLDEDKMKAIYAENKELMDANDLSATMKEEVEKKKQEVLAVQQIKAVKEQSRSIIRTQIAQLEAEHSAIVGQKAVTPMTDKKWVELCNKESMLRNKIRKLEDELYNI